MKLFCILLETLKMENDLIVWDGLLPKLVKGGVWKFDYAHKNFQLCA